MSKEYEELIQKLKDLAKQILEFDYFGDSKNIVNFMEFIDHEIWLTKIKIYRDIEQ